MPQLHPVVATEDTDAKPALVENALHAAPSGSASAASRAACCSCTCSAGGSSSTTRATTRRSPGSARSPTPSACATRSTPTTSRRSTTRRASSSQDGKRPLGVGFFFSLGHSTIVFSLAAGLAVAAKTVNSKIPAFQDYGGYIGASVSGTFLLLIGAAQPARAARHPRRLPADEARRTTTSRSSRSALANQGLMSRFFLKRVGDRIDASWKMYPLGILFGLGFDTATEIGLLALAAGVATHHVPFLAVVSLPIIFAAGMSLMDTADGAFMSQAYGWAFSNPIRKVYYNITVTSLSVAVALADRHDRAAAGDWPRSSRSTAASGRSSTTSTSARSATSSSACSSLTWAFSRRALEDAPDRGALGRHGRGRAVTTSACAANERLHPGGVDGQHDVARLLPGLDVARRLDDLVERVRPVDHRPVLARLDELLEEEDVLLPILRDAERHAAPMPVQGEQRHVPHEPEVGLRCRCRSAAASAGSGGTSACRPRRR